jgi:predicted membrane-bound mannosyltransferase
MSQAAMEAVAPAEESRAQGAGLSISVETLVWAALLAAAAALRVSRLDSLPFTLEEARRALESLSVAGGTVPEGWSGDLAAAGTAHLFDIFGEGERLARLPGAAAGAAAVAAIWAGRSHFGRVGALTAATLVAFSPLAVLLSRSAVPAGAGMALAAVMAVSALAYLREPRPLPLFALVLSLSLAPLTDAIAVSGGLGVMLFLALEGALFGSDTVERAWRAFRRSPSQWLTVALVVTAVALLGLTHFATSTEHGGVPGLRQWTQMFDLPRDSRAPEYHGLLLIGYDWPILLAGSAGFLFLGYRAVRGGTRAAQRLPLVWTGVTALTIALTTQREAWQLLALLLPLALAAGALAEEASEGLDWRVNKRWWPL